MKKILVFVYRAADGRDCTSNGLTSKISSAWLFSDAPINEIVQYCEDNNIDFEKQLVLNKRTLWGERHFFAEPVCKNNGSQMFGGNYVCTSDSRFNEITGDYKPIPVHDRFEQ